MSEATPEAAPAGEPTQQAAAQPDPASADTTDWKAEARKWEERAKKDRQAATELERQRQASMTEAERAVAEAEARGRSSAAQDFGKRLATSEIRAAAADAGADLTGVFDYLDLGRFVADDGEPDAKAIRTFVGGLPKRQSDPLGQVNLDLGTRAAPPIRDDMSQLIRKAAGRA